MAIIITTYHKGLGRSLQAKRKKSNSAASKSRQRTRMEALYTAYDNWAPWAHCRNLRVNIGISDLLEVPRTHTMNMTSSFLDDYYYGPASLYQPAADGPGTEVFALPTAGWILPA